MAFDTRKVNYRAALLTGIIIPSWQEQSPNPLFDQRPRVASRLLRPALLLLAQDKARRGVDPPEPVELDRSSAGEIVRLDRRHRAPRPLRRRRFRQTGGTVERLVGKESVHTS